MTEGEAVHLLARGIFVASELLLPVLIVSLVVGVAISLVQAATQVQEMTLSFAPKLAAIVVVLLTMGPWMIGQLVDFTRELFNLLPQLVR
jgi:flagellar biosynthetic protein FliQ